MREVSISAPRKAASAAVFLLLAVATALGAQPTGAGPTGRLSDRPTSFLSRPDRLELSCEWMSKDQNEKKFFVVFPPGRALEPEVLEAKVEPVAVPSTTATKVLTNARAWLTSHPVERGRLFTTEPVGYWRHYRIVAVSVTPSLLGESVNYQILRLRWVYRWKPEYQPAGGFTDEAFKRRDQGFGAILPGLVANPDGFGIYAEPNPPDGEFPEPLDGVTFARLADTKRPLLRLSVDEKALYRLDPRSLSAALKGAPPELDHTQLFYRGLPVPLYLHRDPSRPDQPAELIFYGTPSESKYTKTNRYWLAEDKAGRPVRMGEAPLTDAWRKLPPQKTFPESLVIEQDEDLIIHTDNFLTINEFQWVWGEIPQSDQAASASATVKRGAENKAWFTSATFALPGLAEPTGQTEFDVSFFYSALRLSQPTRLEVRINDGAPQILTLQEPQDLTKHFSMPNNPLRETTNTITVRFAPGQPQIGESVYFDRLVAHYRRRFEAPGHGFTFSSDPPTSAGWRHYALRGKLPARPLVLDVGNPVAPRVIQYERDAEGALHFGQKEKEVALYRVLSLDDISSPTVETAAELTDAAAQTTPIDYLIIAHHDFLDLLDPLVKTLSAAGWRVRVVDVESVYASFSWGMSSPLAIKAYLAYALRHWPGGGPSYVLFVGDCTSDYRGDFRNKVKNFVPSYTLVSQHGQHDKWVSEHWFTTVCGTDEFSDVILGRLSVNSREDAKTVIDKIVRYRTEPVLDPWRMTLTYVADEDVGASFAEDAERLRVDYKPPALVGQAIYLQDFPWEDNFYLPPEIVELDKAKVSPVCTTRILDMFNRGSTFVSYNGHGSPNIWSNYRIWFGGDSPNSDILMLRNGPRLPFIVNLTCNSGAIDYPEPPWNLCISEDFMRSPTGGAIGLFVPSGPGVPTTHMRLTEDLHDVWFHQGVRALGDCVCLTTYRYLLRGYPPEMDEMIKMYLFLGEPSCPMQLPDKTFALEADRTLVSALSGGPVRVTGRSDLGEGQKGVLALYSPKDEQRFSIPLPIAADGRFEQTVTIPAGDENSSWTVRTYCWNETTKHDAVGWVRIKAARPEVVLTRFEVERSGGRVRAGDPTTFTCTVANHSPLAADGVIVTLSRITPAQRLPAGEAKVTLAGGEERTLRLPWKPLAGCVRLEAQLSGPPELIGPPSPNSHRKTLELAVVGAKKQGAVEISSLPVTTEIAPLAERFERRNALVIGSVGNAAATSVSVALADETSPCAPQKIGTMAPGEIRAVQFQRPLSKPLLPREYRVALDYVDPSTSKPVAIKRTEPVKPGDFPDLMIPGDQITFRDEANEIVFHDPRPTDGHTVYIKVPVKNIGGGSADHPFSVEAFEGDPAAGGKSLRSSTESSTAQKDIPFLDPGQVRTVEVRWDPIHNAGPRPLWFRVDGENRITESSKSNNTTSRTLYVLSKGKLATAKLEVKIPTFEQAKQGIRPLGATVMNVGETTVTQVIVDIYIGVKQTPDNKIGEVLVPQLGPKSSVEAMLDWKPTVEEFKRAATEKFSFNVRLKGSTQRVIHLPGQ